MTFHFSSNNAYLVKLTERGGGETSAHSFSRNKTSIVSPPKLFWPLEPSTVTETVSYNNVYIMPACHTIIFYKYVKK